MIFAQLKELLPTLDRVAFQLPDGSFVPGHFHVTEVGKVQRHFIDCGGTIRHQTAVSLQLWHAQDYDHRLHPEKLLRIICLSEQKLGLAGDLDIEVEYQGATIGRYSLEFNGSHFILGSTTTACLAQDACGVPAQKKKIALAQLKTNSCCNDGAC